MTRLSFPRWARALAVGVGAAAVAACSSDSNTGPITAPPPADPLFASYVALGNSITAGYQSGGINDSTQRQSYARLLAQAMVTPYAYPSLAMPGCPPPIANFQTQVRVGGATSTDTTCLLRTPASIAAVLNNVAVPNASSYDPTAIATPFSNPLTTLFLGGETMVQRAADARPTFITAWIGNNDVLIAAFQGVIDSTAAKAYGLPGRVTPQATFQSNYGAMVSALKGIGTIKGGVLVGVVQVSASPILFPAAALFNPQFKAGFDQFAGGTTTILGTCTPTTTALISFRIVSAMRAGQHPRAIGCARNSVPGTPVGDVFVLDAAEQASIATIVNNYNAYIQSQATANGWAYLDPNAALQQLRAAGCILTVPNLASATQPFGPCISLDGVHPSAMGHQAIAQALEAVINAKYGTKLGS